MQIKGNLVSIEVITNIELITRDPSATPIPYVYILGVIEEVNIDKGIELANKYQRICGFRFFKSYETIIETEDKKYLNFSGYRFDTSGIYFIGGTLLDKEQAKSAGLNDHLKLFDIWQNMTHVIITPQNFALAFCQGDSIIVSSLPTS